MQMNEPFYLHILRESLAGRQRRNSAYSLRAFAKDLEIDSSNLSAILQNKRALPATRAEMIAKRLKLSPKEAALFVASTLRKKVKLDAIKIKEETRQYLLDDKYYKVISEWEYYAFLQLLQVSGVQPTEEWMAEQLGLSIQRLKQVICNLLDLGFIKSDVERGYLRLTPSLETSEDIESRALQLSHTENLSLAKEKLETVSVERRDFTSVTIAINPQKISEAKVIIREFQEKLYSLLSEGEKSEVYQFNCQLFPLTHFKGSK